jgi:hypothetical protein
MITATGYGTTQEMAPLRRQRPGAPPFPWDPRPTQALRESILKWVVGQCTIAYWDFPQELERCIPTHPRSNHDSPPTTLQDWAAKPKV